MFWQSLDSLWKNVLISELLFVKLWKILEFRLEILKWLTLPIIPKKEKLYANGWKISSCFQNKEWNKSNDFHLDFESIFCAFMNMS